MIIRVILQNVYPIRDYVHKCLISSSDSFSTNASILIFLIIAFIA